MDKYRATLERIYALLPMFQQEGASAFKPDLSNTYTFLDYLDNPQDNFRSIHIAGTNGKGSTAHILASLMQENGFKTGIYTSPHYLDFRERIKIDGTLIDKAFVTEFIDKHIDFIRDLRPSFFEVVTVMAFQAFAEKEVDVAIVETGLGGRLDSTNVLHPLLSIITTIDYDHQAILGDTLEEIAGEKAGIIKPETAILIGDKQEETHSVFEDVASANAAPLFYAEDCVALTIIHKRIDSLNFSINIGTEDCRIISDIAGAYQLQNIRTAVAAYFILRSEGILPELAIDCVTLQNALGNIRPNTRFMGRWQVLHRNPLLVLDSAHNRQGMQNSIAQLESYEYEVLHIVIGFVKDKDWKHIIRDLPKHAQYYCVSPRLERGLDAEILMKKMILEGFKARKYPSTEKGLEAAFAKASEYDILYVGGSSFVVGEVLGWASAGND